MTRSPRGQHGGYKEELGCGGCWTRKAQSVRTRKAPLWCHHHLEVSQCLGKLCQDCPGQSALPQVSWSLRAGHQVPWPGPGRVMAAHSGGGDRPLLSFWESSEGRKWSYHSGMTVGATGGSSCRQMQPWVPVRLAPSCSSLALFPLQAPGDVGKCPDDRPFFSL